MSIIDELGHEIKNIYDSRNRLIARIDSEGNKTSYRYDLDNNLTAVIDPLGNSTNFVYDARNRTIKEIDAFGKETLSEYDVVDNLIAQVDRNNRRTAFNYDDLDRVTTETWVETNQVINYSYDKVNNLTSVRDKYSALTFTYDHRNRVKSVDNTGTPNTPQVVLNYTYDGVGNMLSVTDTINGVINGMNSYTYDALNRLIKLTQSGSDVSDKRVDFEYNQLGQYTSINRHANLTGTQLVNGTTYTYDSLNRLTNLTHSNGTANVAFYNYVYDAASRIIQIIDIDGVTDYSYDDRNQLIGANNSNVNKPDENYSYDGNGNRTNTGYQTGINNRLTTDGTYNYEYDNEGNLIKQTEIATGNIREFEWDYRNRLVAVIDKDVSGNAIQKVEFTYDALNRRIAKEVDINLQDNHEGIVTHFVYNGDNVLLEFVDNDGDVNTNQSVLSKRYLHGAVVDQVLAQENGNGNVIWHLSDHLGTIRDLVDNSGEVVNHFIYDSFGKIISESDSSVDTRYLFTGREFDSEIGLYYYRARYYDAQVGRFISEDPISFTGGDANLYRYVGNSPLIATDPTGKQIMIPSIGPITPTIPVTVNMSCFRSCLLNNSAKIAALTAGGTTGVALGQPTIPYSRSSTKGSTGATSPASRVLSKIFPQRYRGIRFPAPTLAHPNATTPVLGRAIGRWVPIIGYGALTVDSILISLCIAKCKDPLASNCPPS